MAQTLTHRQQRAVIEYMKHGIQSRAYVAAGYRPTNRDSMDAAASRLFRNVKVKAEIHRRRKAMIKRADITMDKLLQDAEDARRLAMASGQAAAAISASQFQGKLVGLLVDRKEQGQPGDFAQLKTEGEVVEAFRQEHGDDAAKLLQTLLAGLPKPAEVPAEPAQVEAIELPKAGDTIN